MSVRVDVSEVSRSLVARPPTPAAPAVPRPRQVIEVDLRRQVPDARTAARAREAAARYADHGTDLLGQVPAPRSASLAGRPGPPDGWMLVGRWLTLVTVLVTIAVALAVLGDRTVV